MRVVIAAAVGALLLAGCYETEGARPDRVVLIVIDTLRRDYLSAYGSTTRTPNIDGLAARGQTFTNAYSSFHQTTMSMGSLFSGHTPSLEIGREQGRPPWNGRTWCGLLRFAEGADDACLPSAIRTLGEMMSETGYWTIGVSSNPLLFDPAGFSSGFDDWVEVGIAVKGPVLKRKGKRLPLAESRRGEKVNRAVKRALSRRQRESFFLYVHYMDVHDYGARAVTYSESAIIADGRVGELLDLLSVDGLLENTLIVLTSDHGERLGEQHMVPGGQQHKGNPSFEELLRVPLIISPPTGDDPDEFIRSDGVYRLLGRLARREPDGRADLEPDELLLTELNWLTYRQGRWKSFRRRLDDRFILVDLERDPAEETDVSKQNPRIVDAHRSRVEELERRLASAHLPRTQLTEDDRERLRSLGYLQD